MLKSQNHSSLSSYAPPSEPLGFGEDESIGAEDIFSMCSLICFIPWSSFLAFSDTSQREDKIDESQPEAKDDIQSSLKADQGDDKQEPKIETEMPGYQPVPTWKQKYIARKNKPDPFSARTMKHSGTLPAESAKRTSLEETLDRCRNIDQLSSSHDDDDISDASSVASDSSSWTSALSIGSGSSKSLFSFLIGTSANNQAKSPSSDRDVSDYSYDAISPCQRNVKGHRRQQSPSGVMDLVE